MKRAIYAMLLLVTLLWAGNSIVARAVHEVVPPFTLALGRWAGALLILAPFAPRHIKRDWPQIKDHWLVILMLGIIGIGFFNALLYSGLRYTTATNALLIQAGIPTLVLVFSRIFFRVRSSGRQIVGVTIVTLGVIIIVFRADLNALKAMSFNRGDALIMCAVVAWALYTTLLRIRPKMHAITFLALTFFIGVVAMLPFAINEWRTFPVHASLPVIGAFAYIALGPSVIAYYLYNKAVDEIGAAAASPVTNLQPLFGAFLATLFLGESLHGYHFVGMALILAGIALPLFKRR